jgi:hypothetical protein
MSDQIYVEHPLATREAQNSIAQNMSSLQPTFTGVATDLQPNSALGGLTGGGIVAQFPTSMVVGSSNLPAGNADPATYDETPVHGLMFLQPATGQEVVRMLGSDSNGNARRPEAVLGAPKACQSTAQCQQGDANGYQGASSDQPVVCMRDGYVPDPSQDFENENPGVCVPRSFAQASGALLQNSIFVHPVQTPQGDPSRGHYCNLANDASCRAQNRKPWVCKNKDNATVDVASPDECTAQGHSFVNDEPYDLAVHRGVGVVMPTGVTYREGNRPDGDVRALTDEDPDTRRKNAEDTAVRLMENIVGPLMSTSDFGMNVQYNRDNAGVKVQRQTDGTTRYYMQFGPSADADRSGEATTHFVCQSAPILPEVQGYATGEASNAHHSLSCFVRGPHVGGVFDDDGTIGLTYDADSGKFVVDTEATLSSGLIKYHGDGSTTADNSLQLQNHQQCRDAQDLSDIASVDDLERINDACMYHMEPFNRMVMAAIRRGEGQLPASATAPTAPACPFDNNNGELGSNMDAFTQGLGTNCTDMDTASDSCCTFLTNVMACPRTGVDERSVAPLSKYLADHCSSA